MDKGLVIFSYVFFTTGVVTASQRGYNFTDKNIRLIGGYSALEGRVEIRKHGVWGTVCSQGFDINDANVLCRMLHKDLRSLEYYIDGRYGVGRGPIFYTYLDCSGSEESIYNCSQYSLRVSCTHSNDIGLMCVGCQNATLETSHGLLEHVNITNFGDVYSGPCMNGLSSLQFMFTCTLLGGWIEHINQCTNTVVRNIRLTGRSDYYMEGFVEVLVGDTWLPLCGKTTINRETYYIDSSKANVVCSMIGKMYKTSSSNKKLLDEPGVTITSCIGNETSISRCRHLKGHECQYHAWIGCKDDGKYNIKTLQLENGSSPYEGRIAIYVDNAIGTVCFDGFDYEDAKVVCRMLGFSASSYYVDAYALAEDRNAMIKNLACSGYENHLNDCSYRVPSSNSYSDKCQSKSTRILCVECGRLNVSNGYVQSYDYKTNTATVRCHTDNPRTVQYICNRTGTWTNTTSCRPLQIQDVRLVGINSTLLGGTVELKINNVWGTICNTGLGYAETKVLCRMMNYRYTVYDTYDYNENSNVGFGPGSGPIHMESLHCSGSEKDISECAFTTETTCSHANDVGVLCGYTRFTFVNISGIRLVNGSNQFNGVVELLHDGVWRSLCGSLYPARRICSKMNMTYLHTRCCAKHEHKSGLIIESQLECWSTNVLAYVGICRYYQVGSVSELGSCDEFGILVCSECPQLNVSRGNLVYSDDGTTAILKCSEGYFSNITAFRCQNGKWTANNVECVLSPPLNVTQVRLADGPYTNAGRLEITVQNAFGTICANEFSYVDGDVACKSINLRYRAADVYNSSFFGPGTGPIYIDHLDCTSDRANIKDCLYRTTGVCNHSNDVSLVCNECGKLVTNLDDRMFLFNDSNIVMYGDCSFYKSYFGQLRAICENGTWKTIGNCIEYSKPLELHSVRLVNGSNPAEGRVEIKVFDTWGTVCSDDFGMKEAEVICSMMGYLHAKSVAVKGSYGIGSGPIFIDDLDCGDDASHINDCEYTTYHNCSHEHDVSVICTDCDNVEIHEGRILTYPVMTTVNASLTFSCNEGFALSGAVTITCELSGKWSSSPPECTKKSNLTLILSLSIGCGILVVMAIIAVSVLCFMRRRNLTLSNIFRKSKDQSVTTNPDTYVSSARSADAGAVRMFVNSGMDRSTEDYVIMDDVTHPDQIRETERPKSAKTTVYETLSDATRTVRSDDYSAIDHASTNEHSADTSSRIPKPKGNRTLPK